MTDFYEEILLVTETVFLRDTLCNVSDLFIVTSMERIVESILRFSTSADIRTLRIRTLHGFVQEQRVVVELLVRGLEVFANAAFLVTFGY